MNGLSGLNMAYKLTLGFAVVIALGFAVFVNTQHAMQSYIHSDNTISARAHDCIVISQNASLASKSMAQEVMAYDYTGDKRHWDAKYVADDAAAKCFTDLQSNIQLLPGNSSLTSSLEVVLAQDGNICNPLEDQSMKLARAGKQAEARQIYETEYVPARSKLEAEIKQLITALEEYTAAQDRAQLKAAQHALGIGWVLQVINLMLGSVAGWLLTRYITRNLKQVSSGLSSISEHEIAGLSEAVAALEHGDLTIQMSSGTEPIAFISNDEFGQMIETFNQMLAKVHGATASFRSSQSSLGTMVREIQQSSAQASNAAQKLSGTSQQICTATQEIETKVHEIAQSSEQSARTAGEVAQGSASQAIAIATGAEQVKELVVAIQSVTRDTEAATQSASQADETAAAGVQAVKKTVAGMKRIEGAVGESSQVIGSLGRTATKIGGIVQTIDEIASQTNLLALNAAIEAARAGESGRGFAVVADEVRKLAERCTGATQDIGTLITEIQQLTEKAISAMDSGNREVKTGMSLAGEAGASLELIQSVVSDLSARVLSIGAAAEQMSASAHEVSGTITEVAAIVEESSASMTEMSTSAQEVSVSIHRMAGTAAQQGAVVESLVDSAGELASISQSLDTLVSGFQVEEDASVLIGNQPRLALRKVA